MLFESHITIIALQKNMNGIRIVKHNSFQRFYTMERNMHPILTKRKKKQQH